MAGLHSGYLQVSACKARGDALCSRDCENPEGRPAFSVVNRQQVFEVRGCPFKQITRSTTAFILDLDKIKSGVVSPFSRSEFPAKFGAFFDMYESWLAFFQRRKMQRDQEPTGLSEIQKYRASRV